jgi:solute:Na+ symporter, SSS family
MLSAWDILMLVIYLAGTTWLGVRFSAKQTSSGAYFLGSKGLPGWAIAMSMFATIISSWAFMALPGKGFQGGIGYLLAASMVPPAAWITARWVVPFFREHVRLSAYEYLERRFGAGARMYGNLAFLIVHFGKMAAILYLLCLALTGLTGLNLFMLIGVVGVAAVIYSYFGGIEGAVWTEVIEGALLLLAGALAIGFTLLGAPGGPPAVIDTAVEAGRFDLFAGSFDWAKAGPVVLVCFSINYYLQKYITDQTIVQRMLLAPSNQKAGSALWRSSLLLLLVWVIFMTVGVLLWAFYQLQPELLPAALRARPDAVFPHFIANELPAGIRGLVLAGLVAGTVSTLSSDLNSLGAVVFEDYYKRFRPAATAREQLKFSRGTVLVSGFLCVLLGMAMTRIQSMADAAMDFVSLVGGGVLGMYLLGMLVKRCSARALYVALALGATFSLWATFCGPGKTGLPMLPRFPLHTLWVGLFANVLVFAAGWAFSFAWPSPTPPLRPIPRELEPAEATLSR